MRTLVRCFAITSGIVTVMGAIVLAVDALAGVFERTVRRWIAAGLHNEVSQAQDDVRHHAEAAAMWAETAAMWQERAGMLADRLAAAESKLLALEGLMSSQDTSGTPESTEPTPSRPRRSQRPYRPRRMDTGTRHGGSAGAGG
jgi:hypothetical protein